MSEVLRQLKEGVSTYQANERVRIELRESRKAFTPVVGPFGVGKTTITERATELDPSIQPISTSTDRPRKHTDPAGFRTATEDVTQQQLIAAIEQGEVLNYDVILGTNTIYATIPDGLTAMYNIGPFTAGSIETFRKLNMERFTPVYIVSPVDMWAEFIRKSLGDRHDLVSGRAPEAVTSAEYALQNLDTFDFVESLDRKGGIDAAAQTIIEITHGRPHTSLDKNRAEELLKDMIAYAKSLVQ